MIISEVSLHNFRVYSGRHELALRKPVDGHNIFLLGGLNGAGKTSLFGALTTGLYGQDAVGIAFQRRDGESKEASYRRYLVESFSYDAAKRGENEMSVGLGFDHRGRLIDLHRTWWFRDGLLEDEDLSIYEDGHPLRVHADDPAERVKILQEYVENVAPARVGKFFFFDGEEIRTIAARQPEQAVVEGLNQLLGFQMLQNLAEDLDSLKTNIRREMPSAAAESLESEIANLRASEGHRTEMAAQIAAAGDEIASLQASLDAVERDLESVFKGSSFESRNQALDALAERERELASMSTELQAFVADVLTLALPGQLFRDAASRASNEADIRRESASRLRLGKLRPKLLKDVLAGPDAGYQPALTGAQREQLRRAFGEAWGQVVDRMPEAEAARFSLLETEELESLPTTLNVVEETARRELGARLVRRRHLLDEIARLRAVQTTFDAGPRAQELLDRKGELLEQRITSEHRRVQLTKEFDGGETGLAAQRGVVSRLEAQVELSGGAAAELFAAEQLKGAALEFMRELRNLRAAELAEATTHMMRQLSHKEDLVHEIRIRPDDFAISILDARGNELLGMSAGEREIFALSLVWALARISGRELPVMIDTPLGRLDQMHRDHVVSRYLPMAGAQVIVLATDSEIDSHWYAALRPHLAQQSLIQFSLQTQSSVIREDSYFASVTESPEAVPR